MFEARLQKAITLKKIIEAIKEIVIDVNFQVTHEGLHMQAMDSSHVALVSLILRSSEFAEYRCDRPQTIGVSVSSLAKILKLAGNDDSVSLKAEDEASVLTLIFEASQSRMSEFSLNLIVIDSEHLGVPNQEYPVEVEFSSAEFARICRELLTITDTLEISVSKDSINFSVNGDIGTGSVILRHNDSPRAEERTVIRAVESFKVGYALRYMNLFSRGSALTDTVKFQMQPDCPIVVTFEFEVGELSYFLAPKITES
jgi:proliferating cell nuclear antigen